MERNGKAVVVLTDTQERIMQILKDGELHTREELWTCLYDPQAPWKNMQMHISLLRTKLRPVGKDILCDFTKRVTTYRLVQHLNSEPAIPPQIIDATFLV